MVAAGVDIGAHTFSHPVLPTLDDETARREIVDAAAAIEDVTGRAVRHFAYPYGLRTKRDVALARGRYRLAVSATAALVRPGADAAEVPRVDCHDVRLALRMGLAAGRGAVPYLMMRRGLRRLRRSLPLRG
jgi:peptidoglycan/xylan/chitin deacetylase (PgdA/CDA1 family)